MLEEAALLAKDFGLPYVSEQSEYSWLARDAEGELLPTCERLGLGFIPYFPLASGLLTGKVSRDRPPAEGTRLHGSELDDEKLDRVERYRAWAEAHGVSLLDVAIGGLAAVTAGRLGDRRCDEAGAGARERCRRRLGTDAGRARRAAGALAGARPARRLRRSRPARRRRTFLRRECHSTSARHASLDRCCPVPGTCQSSFATTCLICVYSSIEYADMSLP